MVAHGVRWRVFPKRDSRHGTRDLTLTSNPKHATSPTMEILRNLIRNVQLRPFEMNPMQCAAMADAKAIAVTPGISSAHVRNAINTLRALFGNSIG
jgi:hypothetical protein